MKKIFLSLFVLVLFIACGKNNSVNSGAIGSSAPGTASSGINLNTQTQGPAENQLALMIDNNQFGNGMATYYETWNQLLSHMPNVTFRYGNITVSSNSKSSCLAQLSNVCLLNFYTSNSFSNSTSVNVTRTAYYPSVDLQAKKNELKDIINRRVSIYQNGNLFEIRTNTNIYLIDILAPLQVNPVMIMNFNGASEQFLGGY